MVLDMQTIASDVRRTSRTGWLLALSPIPFALVVPMFLVTVTASGVPDSSQVTPEIMASIRPQWIALWVVYFAAVAFGAYAVGRLAREVGHTGGVFTRRVALGSRVGAALSFVSITANLVLYLSLIGFDEPRLELSSTYELAYQLSLVSIWFGWLALIFAGMALWSSGLLRRAGLVVATLAGLLGVVDVTTQGGIPPFVISFLWLAVGVGLLRRAVSS